MLTQQRKRLICDRLARDGRVIARDLSAELALSEDTIRRDLRELAAEGRLLRVHGGALPASPATVDLAGRRGMATEEKRRLGRRGAALIASGQTVILDGGTTHLEVVRALPANLALAVVTHSPTIAAALEDRPGVEVILIGGRLFRHSMVAVGAAALEAIARLRADLFFLGVTGLHPEEGITTGDFEEAAVKRALIARSAETVVLATAEKIGALSAHTVAPLASVSTLVTTAEGPLDAYRSAGMAVLRA